MLIYICRYIPPSISKHFQSDTFKRIVQGGSWLAIGGVAAKGWALIYAYVLAHILGVDNYGLYGIVNTTYSTFASLAGFALGTTCSKFYAELCQRDPERLSNIIGLNLIIAVMTGGSCGLLFIFGRQIVCEYLINTHVLNIELIYLGGMIFLYALSGALLGIQIGAERFRLIAFLMMGIGFLDFLARIGGAYFWGVSGVIGGMLLVIGLQTLVLLILSLRILKQAHIKISFSGSIKELGVLRRFTIPAALDGLAVLPIIWYAKMLLTRLPNGISEMGLYVAAQQWYTIMIFFPSLVSQVILPVLSKTLSQGDIHKSRRIILFCYLALFVTIAPVALMICLASPWLMSLFGTAFKGHNWLLIFCVIDGFLHAINIIFSKVMQAYCRVWTLFFTKIFYGVIYIGLALFFTTYGAEGLAGAGVIAQGVYVVVSVYLVFLVVIRYEKATEFNGK